MCHEAIARLNEMISLNQKGTATHEISLMVRDLIHRVYRLEAQQETPASAETKPSSPAIATSVARPNGNRISSETYLLVRVDTNGGSETLAMVTYHEPNLPQRLGEVLKAWQGTVYDRKIHTTWESPSQSGVTQSPIPEAAEAGPFVGGAETSHEGGAG